jgi:hypothetical protein
MDLQECSLFLEHFDTTPTTTTNAQSSSTSSRSPIINEIVEEEEDSSNSNINQQEFINQSKNINNETNDLKKDEDFDYSNLYFEAIDLCLPATSCTASNNNIITPSYISPQSFFSNNENTPLNQPSFLFSNKNLTNSIQLNNNYTTTTNTINNNTNKHSIFNGSKQRCSSEPISHFFCDDYDEIVYDDSSSSNNKDFIEDKQKESNNEDDVNDYLKTIELVVQNNRQDLEEIPKNDSITTVLIDLNNTNNNISKNTHLKTNQKQNKFSPNKNTNNIPLNRKSKGIISTHRVISPNIKPKLIATALNPTSFQQVVVLPSTSAIQYSAPTAIQGSVGKTSKDIAIQIKKKIIRKKSNSATIPVINEGIDLVNYFHISFKCFKNHFII